MDIKIKNEYILLQQLLQICDFAQSGGEAKILVKELDIKVNEQSENRRGKKIYPGDYVNIQGKIFHII